MTDQILHLREANSQYPDVCSFCLLMIFIVEAVMITASTSKLEKTNIIRRLHALADKRVDQHGSEIKLCYVTVSPCVPVINRTTRFIASSQPEKMSKDASFRSILQKLDDAKKFGTSSSS
jgi:hypothetical protein